MMGIYRSRERETGGEGFEVRERDTNRLAIFHGVLVRKGFQPRTVLLKAVLQTRDKGRLVPRCRQRERKLRRFGSFDFSHVREEYVPREESHSQGPFRCHIVPSLPSMSAANIIRLSFRRHCFFLVRYTVLSWKIVCFPPTILWIARVWNSWILATNSSPSSFDTKMRENTVDKCQLDCFVIGCSIFSG